MSSKGMTPTMQIMMRGFPVVGFFMIMHMPSVSAALRGFVKTCIPCGMI